MAFAAQDARPPDFSDEALALRFANRHANDLRYVASWSKWLHWTGMHWRLDDTLLAFNLARVVCREEAAKCDKDRTAALVASAKTVAAVERLAKADRRLAATVAQWDADPWVLNTPGGVIDLRTGKSRPHDASHYLTKITAVSPGSECRTWLAFLDRITAGDRDLQAFIQRMFGYGLTGDTSAHALFFLYGTGGNGKSVAIDTVSDILADYHKTAPIETFTASNSDRHPTDLAGLRGARLVTAVETEEGRRWAESRIKSLTGGDKISARFMRQDFFEFSPQFKLVIAGNHKPGLRSVDEAIRRRFHLVPFTVTIPAADRDLKLKSKLKAEWSGILQWMIDGCLDWQSNGLCPPSAVIDATAAYLEAEDAMAAWIEECCTRDPQGWTGTSELFASWKAWADRAGEFAGSTKRFAQNLETRGFQQLRKKNGRGFHGLVIDRSDDLQPHWSDQ
ncbi:phage/plasmid primase, P4 family [Mesorhizobium sp. INR15]|uniref:phage/plasmid primase, P4 family n=1 Tax=Mesorhizobium sp. INR15 TaxID=2654248 RepID=UPI001AEE4B69|nr:phage/plasmid primase, P4 family [Mesorhizobium sp. INR15]